jgi:hypothetical protein
MDRRKTAWCIVALIGLVACGIEPRSAIVQKVEAAGSGSLSKVSKDGMREWLGKHKDLAYQVDDMCRPIRSKATAQWADSTEGRLCSAARELAFFRSGPVRNSGQTYWPGK